MAALDKTGPLQYNRRKLIAGRVFAPVHQNVARRKVGAV